LQKQWQEARDERATLQRQLAALPLQQANARSALYRTLQETEHELLETAARREFSVVAPVDGKVTALTAKPGSLIAPGQVLGTLVPAGAELEAILYVPSHGIGFIERGARVSLRYRAYPYQKYGQATGTVTDISAASLRPDELDNGVRISELSPDLGNVPVYRIRVRLTDQQVSANGKRFDLLPGRYWTPTSYWTVRRSTNGYSIRSTNFLPV
jgi:membrane fusion protein